MTPHNPFIMTYSQPISLLSMATPEAHIYIVLLRKTLHLLLMTTPEAEAIANLFFFFQWPHLKPIYIYIYIVLLKTPHHIYIGIPFVKDIRPPDKYST